MKISGQQKFLISKILVSEKFLVSEKWLTALLLISLTAFNSKLVNCLIVPKVFKLGKTIPVGWLQSLT